jgi:Protein tyrosine phosphatase-like protein, PTPLA
MVKINIMEVRVCIVAGLNLFRQFVYKYQYFANFLKEHQTMSSTLPRRVWLIATNACMMFSWMHVLVTLLSLYSKQTTLCNDQFVPKVNTALMISFLELFNSITGVTRSKPAQVLIFAMIRLGVEQFIGSNIGTCPTSWSHALTVTCWSVGDTVRFGCFLLDCIAPNGSRWAKFIRYTIGPVLFPLGTMGEMVMVLTMAGETYKMNKFHSIFMYFAALLLWPMGFHLLFTQLLSQRRKFLRRDQSSDKKKEH